MAELGEDNTTRLRENFRYAAAGARCRSATFINPAMAELGQAEWMEGECLDSRGWRVKTMKFFPGDSSCVDSIEQVHLVHDRYMSFGELVLRLTEYEKGQHALGFLVDPADRGQVTGAPLFRCFAEDKGIPFNMQGDPIAPLHGLITLPGRYPANAFRIAAAGETAKSTETNLAVADASVIIAADEGSAPYILPQKMSEKLLRCAEQQQRTLEAMNPELLKKLCTFGFTWSGYGGFMIERYKAREACGILSHSTTLTIPHRLLTHLQSQALMFDLIASSILAAAIAKEQPKTPKQAKKIASIYKDALNYSQKRLDALGDLANPEFLNQDRLVNLNIDEEKQKLQRIINFFRETACASAINMNAIPEINRIFRGYELINATPVSNPPTGGSGAMLPGPSLGGGGRND